MLRRLHTGNQNGRRVAALQLLPRPTAQQSLWDTHRGIIIPKLLRKRFGDSFNLSIHQSVRNGSTPFDQVLVQPKEVNEMKVQVDTFDTFADLNLPMAIQQALADSHVTVPSPIQQRAIAPLLAHESVLLGAQSGSGKTLAFLAPLFANMLKDRDIYNIPLREGRPRAIIMVPTHEMVQQMKMVCAPFEARTGLKVQAFLPGKRSNRGLRTILRKGSPNKRRVVVKEEDQAAAENGWEEHQGEDNGEMEGTTTSAARSSTTTALAPRANSNQMPDILITHPAMVVRSIKGKRLLTEDLRYVVLDDADTLIGNDCDGKGGLVMRYAVRRMIYRHLWPTRCQFIASSSCITRELRTVWQRNFPSALTVLTPNYNVLPRTLGAPQFHHVPQPEERFEILTYYLKERCRIRQGTAPEREDLAKPPPTRLPRDTNKLLDSAWRRTVPFVGDDDAAPANEMDEAPRQITDGRNKKGGGGEKGCGVVPVTGTTMEKKHPSMATLNDNALVRVAKGGGKSTGGDLVPWHGMRQGKCVWEHLSAISAPFAWDRVANEARERYGLRPEPGKRVIVFFETAAKATAIFHRLRSHGFGAALLTGRLPKDVRREFFHQWTAGECNVLCATHVAATGLDVAVDMVINFDMPDNAIYWLRTAGRAARMGRKGEVVSFYDRQHVVLVSAIRETSRVEAPLGGVTNFVHDMRRQRFEEYRMNQKNKLARNYVNLVTKRIVPRTKERTYVRKNAMWIPVYHPITVKDHAGFQVAKQEKIYESVMRKAVDYRKAMLAKRKGGSARLGPYMKQFWAARKEMAPLRFEAGTYRGTSADVEGPPTEW